MKNTIVTIILMGLMIAMVSQKAVANEIDNPFIKGQIWNGWYECGEGKTKLKFIITATTNARTKQRVSAIFDFTSLRGVNGAFNMNGRYKARTQEALFSPANWIKKPAGYKLVKIQGAISNDAKEFTGKILYRGCSDFKLFSPESDYLSNPSKYKTAATNNVNLTISPRDIATQYKLGLTAVNQGDLDKAEAIFNALLKQKLQRVMVIGAKNQLASIDRKRKQQKNRMPLVQKKNDNASFEALLAKQNQQSKVNKNTNAATASVANASYKFEQYRPPSNGSHAVYMHFNSIKDLATISARIDDIVKQDLMKRAQQSGNLRRIRGQYNFFVNGKEIEWRRYKYLTNKGWEPVEGNALEAVQRARRPSRTQRPKERFQYSIINQALKFADSPSELSTLFNLGYFETGSIPSEYKFKVTHKTPTSSEKWYNKKKVIMKGISYSIEVEVDNFERLIEDRENLIKYAKLDLINRVGEKQYDNISGYYWFKSDSTNKRSVSVNIDKRAGGGLHENRPLALLNAIATGSEEDFSKTYRISKAMFIAQQNGNKKKVNALKNKKIAEIESNSTGNSEELKIASKLNDVQKLPILYMTESRKWNLVGGFSRQVIARKAADKYGFPMKTPLSPEQIISKKRELTQLIEGLGNKGKQFEKAAPRVKLGSSSIVKLSPQQQKQLSEQVLYPAIMEIQSKTIDLLSRIPRTEQGLDEAFETNKWLFLIEDEFTRNWRRLMEVSGKPAGGAWRPNPLCENISTDQKLALGPKTGRCFFEITHSSRLLREVWRIQYMREIDEYIANKIEENGVDLYRKAFLLAYDMKGNDFDHYAQSNFSNFGGSPAKSSERCLFDNCSSQLTKLFISEYSGKVLTNKRKKQYLATLESKSKEFLNSWNASSGQSKLDRYSIQSDIITYSTEVAKNILLKLSVSATKELVKIKPDDQKAYRNWNNKTAKRIRKQVVAWRKLWDIGFGIGNKDDVARALGLPTFNDGYLNARYSGGSPFNGIAEILYNTQYQWITKSEKGTTADSRTEFPSSWSSSGSYRQPARPTRHYGMLLTPSDLFFESIGQQIGQATSALASYASLIVELEKSIVQSRKKYFNCLPNCSDLRIKEALYSKALIEKDIYFLQLSGQTGSLVDEGHRSITTIIEGISGSNGFTLVDNGIPKVCSGYFDNWLNKIGESHGRDGKKEIDEIFGSIIEFTNGNISALKEAGFKMMQKQQQAFAKSSTEYRKYQICRDQYEFDQYAR